MTTVSEYTIPRTHLGRIISVTRVLMSADRGLTRDEISVGMNLKANTGSANVRVIAARQFGAITAVKGSGYALTELGIRLAGPRPAKTDLLEAVRNIPIFSQVLDRLKGGPLAWVEEDLRRAFVDLGLPDPDVERAVAVLHRSLAYIAKPVVQPATPSDARLVSGVGLDTSWTAPPSDPLERTGNAGRDFASNEDGPAGSTTSGVPHKSFVEIPIIRAILDRAPGEGMTWPADRKAAWLELVASAIKVTHPEG